MTDDSLTVAIRRGTKADLKFLRRWMVEETSPEWKLWDGPYFHRADQADEAPDARGRIEWERSQLLRMSEGTVRIIEVCRGGTGEADAPKPVGFVSRFEEEPAGGGWWELGIVIFSPHAWGRGVGTAALDQWAQITGEETGARVLTVTTWSGNERMIRAAQRGGFTECARVPQARAWDGRRWDSVKLARLNGGGSESAIEHLPWTCTPDEHVPNDVSRILQTLPEWFGIEEANAEYIEAARTKETWAVRDDAGQVIGVTLIDRHFPGSADVYFMAVERSHHGTGVGTAMVAAVSSALRRDGVRLLQVKTLGASHPDPGYARTRHFYESTGFIPLEETDLWGEHTPCLIMVKVLGQ